MNVIIYTDRSYRGGHYFGKIPLHTKKELARSAKAGTHPLESGSVTLQVMNKDPEPYGHMEYWLARRSPPEADEDGECPKCYWGK